MLSYLCFYQKENARTTKNIVVSDFSIMAFHVFNAYTQDYTKIVPKFFK